MKNINLKSLIITSALVAFLEQFTSLRNTSDHIDSVVKVAKDAVAVDLAESLTHLLRKETSEHTLQECIRSILLSSADENQITELFCTLAQMVITRIAAFRLLQVATPEAIFKNR